MDQMIKCSGIFSDIFTLKPVLHTFYMAIGIPDNFMYKFSNGTR